MTTVADLPTDVWERLAEFKFKSDKIKYLNQLGMSTSDISRALGLRYQHVYNVLRGQPGASSQDPGGERLRVKISATVDPTLLRAVDRFVEQHRGYDRSKVLDEALYLWCAREQDRAMEAQFAAPRTPLEEEEHAAWRRIRDAAARRIFGPR